HNRQPEDRSRTPGPRDRVVRQVGPSSAIITSNGSANHSEERAHTDGTPGARQSTALREFQLGARRRLMLGRILDRDVVRHRLITKMLDVEPDGRGGRDKLP